MTTVLTNRLMRGVATALTWLNPSIRFYEPSALAKALEYLDIVEHASAVKAGLEKARARARHSEVLRMLPWHESL